MLDTNVLISMIFFPGKRMDQMLGFITRNHTLVLSSFVVDELLAVAERKFPEKRYVIDRFLSALGFELVYTPHKMDGSLFHIRDVKDYPVLYTAIVEGIDILVTGDKDFLDIDIEKPEILTPSDFAEKFLNKK